MSLAARLSEALQRNEFLLLVLSRALSPSAASHKVTVRPVDLKEGRRYQWITRAGSQERHENLTTDAFLERTGQAFGTAFGDAHLYTRHADITARTLEMFGRLGVDRDHPAIGRALQFVWREQERDHCWYGRWGVNYLYGTWQVLVGLREIGVPVSDPRVQAAARWLKDQQQASGGWGESALSYDQPQLRGAGPATASQTAWALLGLMAAGEVHSPAVQRGVDYLLGTQRPDGTWDEDQFTGTGFPRVFYLKYHYYRIYFPLMALARYARLRNQPSD